MSRSLALIRREFLAFAKTKTFVVGTLFGPLLMSLFIVLPIVFSEAGGTREVVVVAPAGGEIGEKVAATLAPPGSEGGRYRVRVLAPPAGSADSVRAALRERVAREEIDGWLWIPPSVVDGEAARYEGRHASSFRDVREMRAAVERAVREERLRAAGIDPGVLAEALGPVALDVSGVERDARGSADDLFLVAQFMGMALYLVLLLYGNAILRGVREEKENRVVEVVLSSVRPEQLMAGKVFGIGLAGLLQVGVWVAFAALALVFGEEIAASIGSALPELPRIPWQAGAVFLAFFAGGYFLYAAIYASLGAVATSGQEAQNLQYPAIVPLFVGFMMIFAVIDDPGGTLSVAGSLIPFTAPMVVPVRAAVAPIPPLELVASGALLAASCWAFLWLAGRVYRVTILSTGRRPTLRQLVRWVRSA